jgi:hypothetical protein
MRDEDFEYFISKFGEATSRADVPAATIERWRGRLPEQLLTYWQQEGWCGYGNGLFWTVDPDDYEDIVDEWLDGTALERLDAFHVIARSAFGELYACGEKTGPKLKVQCATHSLIAIAKDLRPKTADKLDFEIRGMFSGRMKPDCDMKDEAGQPLFDRALRQLGPLTVDEMYGFEPALAAGGRLRLENLRRIKLDQHLTILRQLAAPKMPFSNIDIEKLMKS